MLVDLDYSYARYVSDTRVFIPLPFEHHVGYSWFARLLTHITLDVYTVAVVTFGRLHILHTTPRFTHTRTHGSTRVVHTVCPHLLPVGLHFGTRITFVRVTHVTHVTFYYTHYHALRVWVYGRYIGFPALLHYALRLPRAVYMI